MAQAAVLPKEFRLNYEDYLYFPEDDGKQYEIIEGRQYMAPSPITIHQRLSRRLARILEDYVCEHQSGEVFSAPFDVVFSDENIVQPDIIYIARENESIITEKNIQGTPDLLIEILSDSSRRKDKIIKRSLYVDFGVREYWVVDPGLEMIETYRKEEGYKKREYEAKDNMTSSVIEGLTINLEEIFKN
ncbi:Uma2 family endonuclease [bacterium]|nr:Uma2 family endonuclease [bacterium]MBU1613983.1 Uma2 family endonuclease [bacterium]